MRALTFLSLVTGATLLAALAGMRAALAVQAGAQWPEMLGDAHHSSHSTDSAISKAVAPSFGITWMANLYSADLGSPVVAFNASLKKSVVYVGNQRADLFAIDASTGQLIWSTNLGVNDKIEDTPMVAPDGSVWVGTSYDPNLYKVDGATGKIDCTIKAMLPVNGSPMFSTPPGGVATVYWDYIDSSTIAGPTIATRESDCSQLFSFSKYIHHSGSWTTPAYGTTVSGEPLVLVGTADTDSAEYAIDATTGHLVWDYVVANPPPGIFDVGAASTISEPGTNAIKDGVAYINTKYGEVYALDLTTGNLLWQFEITQGGARSSSRSSSAFDGFRLVFGYGSESGFGGSGGVDAIDARTGRPLWQFPTATEVLSSPAIVGPKSSEVVALGDIGGAFRLLDLSNGTQLYTSQTGGYITASPAEAAGTIFITSSDGFLYAFGPHGSNAAPPASTITFPANLSSVANPNGGLTITGSSSDSEGVGAVEIAIQSNGVSGLWYDAATDAYNSAPVRNAATLANPGATSTAWSMALPAPAGGGTFSVFANSVSTTHVVDRGTIAGFTILPSKGEPNVWLSRAFVPPGSSFSASSTAFTPGERVTFSFFGKVVATATASSNGHVPKTTVSVPTSATFGPTSLTLTGESSGKTTSATLTITNAWNQAAHDALHSGNEANDPVIKASTSVGNGTVLEQSWYYQANAPVNSSPSVASGVAYFGSDAGVLSAVVTNSGAPAWTYLTPSGAPIRTAPGVDANGSIVITSSDGNMYVLGASGGLTQTVSIGGNPTSPTIDNGRVYVASNTGKLYDFTDPGFTQQWTASVGPPIHSAPAYDSARSLVIVGEDGGAIKACDSETGARKWSAATGGSVTGAVMLHNGVAYAGSADGSEYAIDEATGAMLWKYSLTAPVVSAAALYKDDTIAVGDSKGIFVLVSTSGHKVSETDTHTSSPIVGLATVEGNIMVVTANGTVGMIRPNGPVPFAWSFTSTSPLSTTAAIVDGTVYIGAADGGLYAFTPQGARPDMTRRAVISISEATGWACTTR